jgi:Tfp pilus assembly protein PilX
VRAEREAGVALLLALVVLVALGAVSLTALTLARTESLAGLAAVARVQARGAAEAALAVARLGWPASSTPGQPGAEISLASVTVPGPADGQAKLRNLGGSLYGLEASGVRRSAAGLPLASIRLELLVLLGAPDSNSIVHPSVYPRGWRLLP